MVPAIGLIIVQFRNRRTGVRRTFQISEVLPGPETNVLMQYDSKKDKLVKKNESKSFFKTLSRYTGYEEEELRDEIKEKQRVLEYLQEQDIVDVDSVGRIIAEYYTNKENLMEYVDENKPFQG